MVQYRELNGQKRQQKDPYRELNGQKRQQEDPYRELNGQKRQQMDRRLRDFNRQFEELNRLFNN